MLRGEGNENCEKTTIGLISKKTTLHVQHTFFVHFFAVVWHDYVKRPETSWLHVLWRKCRTCSCSLFSMPLVFPSLAASISHFLTAAINSCCCPTNKTLWERIFGRRGTTHMILLTCLIAAEQLSK